LVGNGHFDQIALPAHCRLLEFVILIMKLNKAKGAWHIDFGKRIDILWIMEDTKLRNIEGDRFVDFPRIVEEHRWGLEFPVLLPS
jgi:hypothetical protein